ncbi:unnamed protein product [marine sediment metagenome]|uniref:PIG-L family deacetylase n=1 Tax=marine sediment metagenome TaxID=412755 RepID=X1FUB3_9ZZZZ
MKKIKKIGIAIILIGICAVAVHIIYLFTLTPKEKYPEDTYLKSEQKKSALIIVAHDDDAVLFSGTTSLLAANGWDISFMCFYTDLWRPEDNPTRKLEMEKVLEIEGLKNLELIDFTITKYLDTIDKPWMPIPFDKFPDYYKIDSLKMYVLKVIKKYNPSVVFTLDNEIGFYGNPVHVLVSQIVTDICSSYKDSLDFSVKKIYQGVYPPSMAEKIMGDKGAYQYGKEIYHCDGMPEPDVQIDISSYAMTKKRVHLAHASQHRNLKKFIPYYHYYPGWLYFRIFNKEYFRIINVDEL